MVNPLVAVEPLTIVNGTLDRIYQAKINYRELEIGILMLLKPGLVCSIYFSWRVSNQ